MLPTKFRFIWQSGYRGEDSLEINQSETRIAGTAMFFKVPEMDGRPVAKCD
jgi:hypothetical protein